MKLWLSPHRAEPIRKMTRPTWRTIRRPYRSPSLPYRGVTTVWARRYAVVTQEMWLRPPRSRATVGRAVATMVESRAARSMTSINPRKTVVSWRPCSWGGPSDRAEGTAPSPPALVTGTRRRHAGHHGGE